MIIYKIYVYTHTHTHTHTRARARTQFMYFILNKAIMLINVNYVKVTIS